MRKAVTISTMIFSLVVFSGIVVTQEAEQLRQEQLMQMPMRQGMMGGDAMGIGLTPQMILSLVDELRLEDEQKKTIQKIDLDFQKEIIRQNANLSIAEIELNAFLAQDEIDLRQAQQKIQQITALKVELTMAPIKAFVEARGVLTDEQRRLLFTWRTQYERHGIMREMHERRSYTTNGERIYYTATNDSGHRISFRDGPPWLRLMGGSCVNCHGVDGKGGTPIMMTSMVAPDITYQSLTSDGHVHNHGHDHQEGATTYTSELIKRAITDGLGASGYPLSKIMPRWRMSEQDLDDLLEYLRNLGGGD